MKYIISILLVASLVFFTYPYIDEEIQNKKERELLAEFTSKFNMSATEQQVSYDTLEEIESILQAGDTEYEQDEVPEVAPRILDDNTKNLFKDDVIALISIEKIDLLMPILEGATEENMKYAATRISETTPIGDIGNTGISAHRARTKGRLFHDLDEVEIGDKIVIRTMEHDLTYTVFKTLRVFPVQVSVLNRNNVDSILTLITCDPAVNSTHRLIVQAKLDA